LKTLGDKISLTLDTPAECARKLANHETDIGLVPVAAIDSINGAHEITKWCIGADGPVKSVMLFSDVPLQQVTSVMLDYQSRTSNLLVRILASRFWKISPAFVHSKPGFESEIKNQTAGVVIGDRALMLEERFRYAADLAEEWKKFTGKPFVFARWVTVTALNGQFVYEFEEALGYGLKNIGAVLETKNQSGFDAENYLRNNLHFEYTSGFREGRELFDSLVKAEAHQLADEFHR
jgi:chorismate dehydratase